MILWIVGSSGTMSTPVFIPLSGSGSTVTGNGFSTNPYYLSSTVQYVPNVSGTVYYFFTNSTTTYTTATAFQNAYSSATAKNSSIVNANMGNSFAVTMNGATPLYKYVWIMMQVSSTYYTPVGIQLY